MMLPAMSPNPGSAHPVDNAPPLVRRLACFVYEGVLLLGIVMAAGFVYGIATQQRHALTGTWGLQVVIFAVLGLYFVHSWTGQGQTLAMRTWHIRLVGLDGAPVSRGRAVCRYLLSWLWFLPSLIVVQLTGLKATGAMVAVIASGVIAFAALAWLHPRRQYLHDGLCGTRLIGWAPNRRH
jgi:uncharacterized RDD family membrane protein YckC